jgi:hypothetical protein
LNARQNPLTTLEKVEDLLERLLELPFELFPTLIEPIELGKRLCKFMGRQRLLLGDGRQFVPHVYDIYVSPKDYANLSPNVSVLVQDWQNQLYEYAKQRNYVLKDSLVLRLHPKTELRVGKVEFQMGQVQGTADGGTVRIDIHNWAKPAGLAGPPPGAPSPVTPASPSNIHAQVPPMPYAQLTIRSPQGGQQIYRIEKSIVKIGRQLDNDIIVPDKSTGRHHAVIEYQQNGQFTLTDLQSTNGTTVNKIPVIRPHTLRTNDVVGIGKYEFLFERR